MKRTGLSVRSILVAAGLALIAPAPLAAQQQQAQQPAQAQQQARPPIIPMNVRDVRCYTLLRQRQANVLATEGIDQALRAQVVNNLVIVAAFYAGRLTHYPTEQAQAAFAQAQSDLAAATPDQREAFAGQCANFYLGVVEALTPYHQQVR